MARALGGSTNSLFPAFLPRYGGNNQAGDLAPRRGAYGSLWRANLVALESDVHTVQGHDDYNNYLGAMRVQGVHPLAIVRPKGYDGSAPAALQPRVQRSAPWADPRDIAQTVEGD